jgi:apolipoprotein D and lipocalin family protein
MKASTRAEQPAPTHGARRPFRRQWLPALAAGIVSLTIAGAAAAGRPPPETAAFVDLDRYLGTWYEVASIPNRFQKHCRANTTARYRRIEDGRLEVLNSCLNGDGAVEAARGVARVVDSRSNAKLEVSFVSLFGWRLFWGDYWILYLSPDYSQAIVGTPNRRYGWILSRTPAIPAETRKALDHRLRDAGYDPGAFVDTPQQHE